ncbi:MAG TPA: TonB-dependent receptor, partial [Polyangia bacterium]
AALARRAHADEETPAPAQSYQSTVHAPLPQTVMTSIDATQPSARLVSVADLLEGQSGVFVKSRGGLGSFTSVSIRGSEDNEVAILIDGMPLTRAAAGVIDLSALSVAGLERVEVWRGVPPIEFGAEAVGGAINLVTRRGGLVPELRLSVGAGSFGARAASAGWSGTDHGLRIDLSAAYNGASGDFTYYDTAGTLFNQSDDRISTRHNNDFDQGAVDATVSGRHWRIGTHGYIKQQGAPGVGLAGAESLHARLVSARALADGDVDGSIGAWRWRLASSLLYERLGFSNPPGDEAGPFGAAVSEAQALSEGLYARVRVPWGKHQRWLILADLRGEERWPTDLLFLSQSGGASERLIGGLGVEDELRFFDERLTVTAGLRLDGDYNRVSVPLTGALAPTSAVEPTGRVTARLAVNRWLALRGAAGRFVRFPTLLELFGDGAFILPQPTLVPEKAWAGDVGGTVQADTHRLHATLEATFFGRAVDDTIVYLPASRASTAQNIGPTRMLGVEVRAQAAFSRYFAARVDYSYTDARELTGAGGQIPGRPQNQLTLRADAKLAPFGIWYELEFVDRLYRDPANDAWIPARTLHAIGASFDHKWIQLTVEIRNLADLRVVQLPAGGTTVPSPLVDYFNYPLPGRAIYATLVFRK